MRRWTILLAAALLSGCGPEEAPINRIVLPAPIAATADNDTSLAPFSGVYLNRKAHVALFFVGDAKAMSAHFVDRDGLADQTKLLSAEQIAKLGSDDPAREASIGANNILTLTGLPDREFAVLPVDGGFLLQYSYGKLQYLSFLTLSGGRLRLGLAADMNLLARLAQSAGAGSAFVAMPAIADRGGKPSRYLYFTSAPKALGDAITGNAAAIYRDVTAADSDWEPIEVTAPTSLSDTSDIGAIRREVAATVDTPAESENATAASTENAM